MQQQQRQQHAGAGRQLVAGGSASPVKVTKLSRVARSLSRSLSFGSARLSAWLLSTLATCCHQFVGSFTCNVLPATSLLFMQQQWQQQQQRLRSCHFWLQFAGNAFWEIIFYLFTFRLFALSGSVRFFMKTELVVF